ncbi:MAG: flagellar protein FlgN [Planctomycetota bacterium]
MTQTSPANPATATMRPAEALAAHLLAMIAAHEHLLTLAAEHRAAISRADGPAVEKLSAQQTELVRAVATLEQHRRAAARAVVGERPARGSPEPTIQRVLALLPEPDRTTIATHSAKLRALVERVQEEHRVVRRATTLMLSHMEGLMRQVAQALSHAGTYSRAGSVPAGSAQVVSSLDLTT